MLRRFGGKSLIYAVLIVFSLVALFPIYFSVTSSLKTTEAYTVNPVGLPSEVTLDNFDYALRRADLGRYMLNNVIVIPIALVLYLFVCNAAGFAFGLLRFRFRLALFTIMLFLMIFPQMVISVPVYTVGVRLGLNNTYLGIILVWVAYFSPFGAYIMTTYYSSVPRSLIESARIDGARVHQILVRIMMPVALPMIATITIVGFQAMWNELPFSLLMLQEQRLRTVTLGIALMKGEHGLPTPIVTAALVFAMAVPLGLWVFFQRYVAGGATAGAVKG
jgi:ABC-type glycerol-3-phosphate transport system permease component